MRQFDDADLEECPDDGTRLREFRDSSAQMMGMSLDGRWRLEDKIGEGGMGEVYRARQVNVDRVVAVKILRLALASSDQYVARFFREADIATSIQHPHCVTIYDFGQTENELLYIAMELLDGEPLSVVLRRRRLDLIEALTIAAQVCAGLSAAHSARIVHRDLKPDNIFLINVAGNETFAKVLDFGIAKDLDSTDKVTRTGQLFGTPEYMSPEQCEGSGNVDARSDLYAIGCLLYEVLTGRSPFQRDSIIQTLLAQVSDAPKSFAELGIPVPPGVQAIVMKLLEKHPDNRFGSAIETRDAIVREIDRLRTNSGEIHVYETVSAAIRPREGSARTVSYSDLAHPLQLEGVLASSARGAIAIEAGKQRQAEAEKSTENIDVVTDGAGQRTAILAIVVCGAILALFFGLRPAQEPIAPIAVSATRVEPAPPDDTHAAAGTIAAGRAAAIVRLAASSAVPTAPPADATEKPEKAERPSKATPAVNLNREAGLRTQNSMKQRLLQKESALLACYQRREDTFEGGDVAFSFEIEADGTIRSVDVTSDALTSQAVLGCMRRVVSKLKFLPAFAGGTFHKVLAFQPSK